MSPTEKVAFLVCTDKEFAAFLLWNRGTGYRRIADILGISVSTARDRVDRARRKIAAHPTFDKEAA